MTCFLKKSSHSHTKWGGVGKEDLRGNIPSLEKRPLSTELLQNTASLAYPQLSYHMQKARQRNISYNNCL